MSAGAARDIIVSHNDSAGIERPRRCHESLNGMAAANRRYRRARKTVTRIGTLDRALSRLKRRRITAGPPRRMML